MRALPLSAGVTALACGLLVVDCGGEEPAAPPPVQLLPWTQPPPPVCPGTQQGRGAVWLDDPSDLSLVERPLHCLIGDGRLRGTFVAGIAPDAWLPAEGAGNRFVFGNDDPHLQEVQVYYAVTGMAGYYQPAILSSSVLVPLHVELLSRSSFTVSRFDLPDRLQIALQGVKPAMMPLQVLSHEYAHQLILRHRTTVDQLVNEGLADYLAADFTGNPRVLALDRLELPASVAQSPSALEVARRYLERSVDNQRAYPADVVTIKQYCETLGQAAAVFPAGSALVPTQKLALCGSMSPAEQAEPEPHRTGMILSGALWELRGQLGSATVNNLLFAALSSQGSLGLKSLAAALVQADSMLNGGVNRNTLEAVCGKRGLLVD